MYPIIVEPGLVKRLGTLLQNWHQSDRCYLVTDANVANYHLYQAVNSLTRAGYTVNALVLSAGEHSKSLSTVRMIYQWLLNSGADRSSVLIALGGGVICDVAGFAAATFMRGMGLVNAPTSLLAQIDAGVGSKVGVNFMGVKNLIGGFYDPLAVLVDPAVLATLPEQDYVNGKGELVKYALLMGEELQLEADGGEVSQNVIERCLNCKMSFVAGDKTDRGRRRFLNLGHTLGHALEAVTLENEILLSHGEAVALGCIGEAVIAVNRNLADSGLPGEIATFCTKLGLRSCISLAGLQMEKALELINHDKKHKGGVLYWAVPCGWGKVEIITGVSTQEVLAALQFLRCRS